jgi:hypothetical protein
VTDTVDMRWRRRLLFLLFMVIAIGLGWSIAWLGTTPTIDAFYAKVFGRLPSHGAPPP